MHAVEERNVECVKLLICQGADINHRCQFGATPLMVAVQNGDIDCVDVLLQHDARVNNLQSDGTVLSVLMCAVLLKDQRIVRSLLDAGAFANDTCGIDGLTPLMLSVQQCNLECERLLLKYGACVNDGNRDGETPVMTAVQYGNVKGLELLVESDVDVNVQDNCGMSALMFAAAEGDLNCMKVLIDANADLNLKDKWSNNALMKFFIHATDSDDSCALLLIRNGCELNHVNNCGDTALCLAVRSHRHSVVSTLIKRGVNVNHCTNDKTALWYAAGDGLDECVKLLVDGQGNVNLGRPAIVVAARYGTINSINILIEAGANVNAVDPVYGTMALMGAYVGKSEIVRLGLNAGAHVNICHVLWLLPIVYTDAALMLLAAGEEFEFSYDSDGASEAIVDIEKNISLQNLCRKVIRRHLVVVRPKQSLFYLVQLLPLPGSLKKYCVYDVCL